MNYFMSIITFVFYFSTIKFSNYIINNYNLRAFDIYNGKYFDESDEN